MRDLHDDIGRATMLDLTGQDRPVPPLGRSVAPFLDGPATQTHAGASEAAQRSSHGLGSPVRLDTKSRPGRYSVVIGYATEAEADEVARWVAAHMYAVAAIRAIKETM